MLFIFLGNYVALALLLLLPSLIPPRSLVSSSYHFVFFLFLYSPFFSNIFLLSLGLFLFLCAFFLSNLVHVGCLLRKVHWCSICWHIESIFPWMHLRVVINFARGGPGSAFNPKFCSISSFCSLHSLWQNASLSPVLWWKYRFTICFTLLGFQQLSLHFFCKCPLRFVFGFSLFIFCGSGRLASLSTPGWVGWMGLYTALLFFAVFLCDFYLDLCPSLVFSICAISMMYLLGCDGWEATVLCSPLLSHTY